jgi:hypothetical protein
MTRPDLFAVMARARVSTPGNGRGFVADFVCVRASLARPDMGN